MKPLQPGAQGPEVRVLQRSLRKKGYLIPPEEWARECFGPGTQLALSKATADAPSQLGDVELRPKSRMATVAGLVGVCLALASFDTVSGGQGLSSALALAGVGLLLGIATVFYRGGRALGIVAILANVFAGGLWLFLKATSF